MTFTRRMRNDLLLAALLVTALPALAQTDVAIGLEQFGTGNAFRPGDYCAIRLKLTSILAEATPVWVQWEVPNADGDIAEYGRSLTLTPGVPAFVWLYAPLAPSVDTGTVWAVRVFDPEQPERKEPQRATLSGLRGSRLAR